MLTSMFELSKNYMVTSLSDREGCKSLLSQLSIRELEIVKKHPDILSRIEHVSQLNMLEITKILEEEFSLEIVERGTSSLFIDTGKCEDAMPEDFVSYHIGWNKSTKGNQFLNWAKGFLLQEVRINIWLRYLKDREEEGLSVVTSYGQYI